MLLQKNYSLKKVLDIPAQICIMAPMLIEKGIEMTEFEQKCYGITEQDIRDEYMNSLTARLSGLEMVVMGVLSDSQELLAMGRSDDARKQMNIAKFILSEMMEVKREATV